MRKIIVNNKIIATTLCVLLIICMFIGVIVGFGVSNKQDGVSALTTTVGADKVNGELMNGDKLDLDIAKDLLEKIVGSDDYDDTVKYIKNNGGTEYALTGSYLVPSSTISSNTQGLVVQLDGLEWIVSSLTMADVGREKGQIIATLYLADDIDSNTFYYYTDASDTKGNNMYSASIIRKKLLAHASFSNLVSGNFASNYLVQPKYIAYQNQQTLYDRSPGHFDSPNDALENPVKGQWCYTNTMYLPTDTITRGGVTYTYNEWGNDYIWIPSLAETGGSMIPSAWGLNDTQRAHSKAGYSWLRTGGHSHFGYAYRLETTGGRNPTPVAADGALRPAVHLNLTLATSSVRVPEDFTIDYDGFSRPIQAAANSVPTQTSHWNVNRLWNSLDLNVGTNGIKITPLNGEKLSKEGLPKDAGQYKIEFTIAGTIWSSGQETDLTRSITLTINKKKIGVSVDLDKTSKLPYVELKDEGDIYTGDTEENGRAPNLGFNYSSTDGKGYNSDTLPTAIGAYRATAKILNEGCNYVLDNTYYIDFSIDKTKVNKP
ncbi:MAG: hypothetical protein K2N53_01765, partial [Clostridia bacterium]|nr:hypothetical protein [Clostridia bacterium]